MKLSLIHIRAGVALFLGRVCIFCVALRGKIRLTGLHLGLLHRKDIGIQSRKACLLYTS